MNDIKGIIEDVEKSDLVSDKVIKKVIEIIGQEEWQEINDKKSDICTTTGELIITLKRIPDLEKENAELKSIAEFQQSSNMKRHFEIQELKKKNKELDVFLNAGTTFNKALNSTNKALEEERDKYRNMVFDQKDQLTKAKEHIRTLISCLIDWVQEGDKDYCYIADAEQFLQEIEK